MNAATQPAPAVGLLDQIVARFSAMGPEEQAKVVALAQQATDGKRWIPNPGPQTEAYFSKADCLLYGGEPGGGKSQLLLGLAFNEHERSLVMRREYGDLERLIEDALTINGGRQGFNGSPPPRLKISDRQVINFRAAQRIGDEQGTMGQGRDLLAIDEATHFAESQIRFLMGWVRTETPGQRCRTVLATNPPLSAEGLWVVKMFAPWLDPKFPFKAKPGELRWVVSNADGEDEWVEGPDDTREIGGKVIRPTSRTYIPASVKDNPYYAATDYERQLWAMPEPFRSQLMGGFRTTFKDAEGQIIPTAWIHAAQARWIKDPSAGVPMCAMGVDCSGGGTDPMVIAARHDGWFAPLVVIPGKELPLEKLGTHGAGLVIRHRRDGAKVIVDMGGGYGGPVYEHLAANIGVENVRSYKGGKTATGRSADRQLTFNNLRSQALWRFREALDPDQSGGSTISLPPDEELVADLAAPVADGEYMLKGIVKAESKEDVCARLGRSTDKGDAVVMAWVDGLKQSNIQGGFAGMARNRRPVAVLGRESQRRRH